MSFTVLLAILLSFSFRPALSQSDLAPLVPVSPEAASLGKFGDIPVDYSTGVPNITVPIHKVQGKRLSMDVALSYHAGGHKVEDRASREGLGWALVTGGMISRSVRGLPDDSDNGWLRKAFSVYDFFDPANCSQRFSTCIDITEGLTDSEPDMFHYNFNGRSGRFLFDSAGHVFMAPKTELQVNVKQEAKGIVAFTITDTDGVKYYFGKSADGTRQAAETVNVKTFCGKMGLGASLPSPANAFADKANVWYLLEVIDPNYQDSIRLEYSPYTLESCTRSEQTAYGVGCDSPPRECYSLTTTQGSRLVSIKSSLGEVALKSTLPREDLSGDTSLDSIVVKNYDGQEIKTYRLYHSYFTSENLLKACKCDPYLEAGERRKRLRLDSLQEIDKYGNTKPPYRFYYNPLQLPDLYSMAQDHWGFYNGKTGNKTLVPSFLWSGYVVEGADRGSDANYGKASVLEKIVYPTGGETNFYYEGHELSASSTSINPLLDNMYATVQGNGFDTLAVREFEVTGQQEMVQVAIAKVDCLLEATGSPNSECPVSFSIVGITDPGVNILVNHIQNLRLPPGRYRLEARVAGDASDERYGYFECSLSWPQRLNGSDKIQLGGVRVKKITNYDAVAGTLRTKSYAYQGGHLQAGPVYEYPYVNKDNAGDRCPTMARTSRSRVTTNGGDRNYGYQVVEEYNNEGRDGYQKYFYRNWTLGAVPGPDNHFTYNNSAYDGCLFNDNNGTFPNTGGGGADNYLVFPFPPLNTTEWLPGLEKVEYYKSGAKGYQKIKEVQYLFEDIYETGYYVSGLKVGSNGTSPREGNIWFADYKSTTGRRHDAGTIERTFTDEAVLTVATHKEYSPVNGQLKRVSTIDSHGDTLATEYLYAHDLAASTLKDSLLSRNMTGLPLETRSYKNSALSGRSVTRYGILGDRVLPLSREQLFTDRLLAPHAPEASLLELTGTIAYDQHSNIISARNLEGIGLAFTWGYRHQLLTSRVENASPAEVYHTSFEEDGTEGDARTGTKYHAGSTYTIPVGQRPQGSSLVLSYWYYDGSRWQHTSRAYDPAHPVVEHPGAIRLDEVRVHPADALMTTFAHLPMTGLHSVTGPNGQTSTYDYDGFGRLRATRNHNGEIQTYWNYHYQK